MAIQINSPYTDYMKSEEMICAEALRQARIELELERNHTVELEKVLNHNPDTGLYQHHVLMQRLGRILREEPGTTFTYGIIRLDRHYQRIRHTRDRMKVFLYITAERIKEILGDENVYQSDRSDEFLFIIKGENKKSLITPLITLLTDKISESHNPPASDISFGCNVGVAYFPEHATTIDELLVNAEIALGIYEQRRDQGFIYSPELGAIHHERDKLETVMHQAVKNGLEGFHIAYQPLVDENKKTLGCEALMWWDAPGYGSIPPLRFIPIAEENGLIITLGHWILFNAVRQVKIWREEWNSDIFISVNVSGIQLQNPHCVDMVRDVLEALKIDGSCLHLEITESVVMDDPAEMITRLDGFRDLGIKIMLDDFGTGYSSLSYLNQFPIDTLKIAKEFVDDYPEDHRSLEVVRAIQSISRSFGFSTLAEGVEKQSQFDHLIKEGCQVIQGYLISPPVAATEFEERFLTG